MRRRWVGAGLAVACTATFTAAANPAAAAGTGLIFAPSSAAAAASTESSDWAGWDVTGGTYTSVSSKWTEPKVTCSTVPNSSSAFWVGLDGDTSTSVEQTGTEANCVNGVAQYEAWYEFYPSPSVNLTQVVKAGDTMSASVSYSKTGTYTLTIKDLTRDWTTTKHGTVAAGTNASAEVIAEAPTDASTGTVVALADFGTASFTDAKVNGKSIGTVATAKKITMASDEDQALATTSALSANDAFSVAWKSSGDEEETTTTGSGGYGTGGYGTGGYGTGGYGTGGYGTGGYGTGGYGTGGYGTGGYGTGGYGSGGYGSGSGQASTGYGWGSGDSTGYGWTTGYGYGY